MSVLASKASRHVDVLRDVILRGGFRTPDFTVDPVDSDPDNSIERLTLDGTLLETPIPINGRMRARRVEVVIHVRHLDISAADVFVDVVTGAKAWLGEDQRVAVRVALLELGQQIVEFQGDAIPANHRYIAARMILIGEAGEANYSAWICGART